MLKPYGYSGQNSKKGKQMDKDKHPIRILVIHGPNLNMLGKREPGVYGAQTLEEINHELVKIGKKLGHEVVCFQSNQEGDMVDKIQSEMGRTKGIIINPAAFTHTSIAIRDALLLVDLPVVEIHLSNIYKREPFRHKSLVADIAAGQISGFGAYGYQMALYALSNLLSKKRL